MDMKKLKRELLVKEDVLMEKVLDYAKKHDYTKYTSTLKEAWRMSISGLTGALAEAIDKTGDIPEMGPDDDFANSEIAEFGIIEARKHRSRGVAIGMFLGLMKYYCQAYVDLVQESGFSPEEKEHFSQYVRRYFDHIELGFAVEWMNLSEKQMIEELQERNRQMTNEKNKYLTVFESMYDPAILLDRDNRIQNINSQAAAIFLELDKSGAKYYGDMDIDDRFSWITVEIDAFIKTEMNEMTLQKTLPVNGAGRTYAIKIKRMMDVSEKYGGSVVVFSDITDMLETESKLRQQKEKLKSIAYTDPMTGVPNRRTGMMKLERELEKVRERERPTSVCYIDVDGLKRVNDIHGHNEGDELINEVAKSIVGTVRESDAVNRMGGDEFLIIFPECDKSSAEKIIRRIQRKLEMYDEQEIKAYTHTFSYGIIELNRHHRYDAKEVIRLVDEKMYANKSFRYSERR